MIEISYWEQGKQEDSEVISLKYWKKSKDLST